MEWYCDAAGITAFLQQDCLMFRRERSDSSGLAKLDGIREQGETV